MLKCEVITAASYGNARSMAGEMGRLPYLAP